MENFVLKKGSTLPKIRFVVDLQRDGNCTDCTATMRIISQDGLNILEYTPTITNEAEGIIEYQFLDGETDVPGVYWVEMWVTLPSGETIKLPDGVKMNFIITGDIS